MNMTYAAQVRSVSKSLAKQSTPDYLYDNNSLRIICQYFVGNVVIVITSDEVSEGVLHTISNNTVCLTHVTTSKVSNVYKITKVSASKLVSLNNVLCISTKDCGKYLDVTVKGRNVYGIKESNTANTLNNSVKPLITLDINGKKKPNEPLQNGNCKKSISTGTDSAITDKENLRNDSKQCEEVVVEQRSDLMEAKKTFSFNPNAPEFKPRAIGSYSDGMFQEPIIFSPPPPQPYPQVFTPNSAPAIFVPNVFFYAPPNPMNGLEVPHCIDNNAPMQSNLSNGDFHASSNGLPFAPVMPMYQHPMPIFIPNSSFQITNGHLYSSDLDSSVEPLSASIDHELHNPTHWPPLPNLAVPSSTADQVNTDPAAFQGI